MMSEEDLDEAIGDATTDLANTHINGDADSEVVPGVTNKADVENNGVSADEPAPVNQETPPKEQADQQENDTIEENGTNEQNIGMNSNKYSAVYLKIRVCILIESF